MAYLLRTVNNSHGSKKYYDSRIEFVKAIRNYAKRGYQIYTLVRGGKKILMASPKFIEKYKCSIEVFEFQPFTPGYQYCNEIGMAFYHNPFNMEAYYFD